MYAGVAVIFAQFPINQFRSIAWYNAVLGLVIIVTQIFVFRGESSCKDTNCSKSLHNRNKRNSIRPTSEKSVSDICVTISVSFGTLLMFHHFLECIIGSIAVYYITILFEP